MSKTLRRVGKRASWAFMKARSSEIAAKSERAKSNLAQRELSALL